MVLALNAQNGQHLGVWTPELHPGEELALNAQNKHGSGVQRQKWATNGRSTPRTSTNLALNAQSWVQGHFACLIWCKVINPWTPQDLWTPQDHLRICGSHRIPTYLHSLLLTPLSHNPINTLPQNSSPITSISLPYHHFTTHIHPLFPINLPHKHHLPSKFKINFPPKPTLIGRTFTPLPSLYIALHSSSFSHNTTLSSPSWPNTPLPPLLHIFFFFFIYSFFSCSRASNILSLVW